MLRTTVKKCGRQMGDEIIAGEQISTEKQAKALTVKSAVTVGVSRKMNDAQTSPVRQFHFGMQRFINTNGPIPEHEASEGFERPTHAAEATVGERSVDMGLFQRMGKHRSAGELLDLEEVAGVSDVSVGETNRLRVGPIEAALLKCAGELRHFPDESGVDDYRFAARRIQQNMKLAEKPADGIDPVRRIRRIDGIGPHHRPRITGNRVISSRTPGPMVM